MGMAPHNFAPVDHREQGEKFCKTLQALLNALTQFLRGLLIEKNKLRTLVHHATNFTY